MGLCCPHCGEDAPTCLETIDRQNRGGMFRCCCLVSALAGDPGEGGAFTDLTGTIFDGCRLDIGSLWLIIEMFADQATAVETADEVGVNLYTDGYKICNFLDRAGCQHAAVNHSAGECARDELHCNTIECTWSWLHHMVRTCQGVSKVYLPLYTAQFEFFYDQHHHNRWNRMLDVFSVAFQADVASLLANVEGAEFAQICPVTG